MSFNFFTTFSLEHKLIVGRNMHTRGDSFASFTADADGFLATVSNVTTEELAEAGILKKQNGRFRIVSTMDRSADAQAAAWGEITRSTLCSCDTEPGVEDWQRFERHDGHGEFTGEHGFACPTCRGIVQVG